MAESNATQVILTDDGIKIIKAQNTADNATGGVTDLNDPNLMNVIEKQTQASQYAGLTSQYKVVLSRAKEANISTTALTTAYTNLNTFMGSVLADTTVASDIDRDTYKNLTDAYNVALSNIQTALSNSFNTDISNMQSSVSVASQAASSAVIVASQAAITGDNASQAAEQASMTAKQAQAAGDNATSVANNASQAASGAVIAGSTATVNADKAINVASQAQIAGNNATSVANSASQAASNAILAGSTATVKADKAINIASQAQIAGDNAISVANNASQAASNAILVGSQATVTANNASTAASQAQIAGDNATSTANNASQAADNAILAGSTATATANKASADYQTLSAGVKDGSVVHITTETVIDKGVIGTAEIANGAITNAQIGSEAVGSAQIADLAVGTAQIGDGAITNAKIGKLAVGTAQIANGAITNAQIGNAAVDTANIKDAAINSAKIASLAVGTAQIGDGAITNAKIGKLAVGTAQIANGAITDAQIGSLAVGTANIKDAAISSAKIANLAVGTAQIGDGAITNAKIGKLAVGTAQIANAAITDAQVGNVSANKLTAGTIDFNTITGKNINASNITTGTLSTDRLNVGELSALSANLGNVTTGSLKGVDIVANSFSTPNGSFTTDSNGTITAKNMTLIGGTLTSPTINASTINGSTINGTTFNAGTKLNSYGNTSYPLTINQDGSVTSTSFGNIANDPAALRTVIKDGSVKTNFRGMKQLSTGAYPAADVALGAGQLALLEGYSNSQDPNFTATGMKTTGYAILDASTGLSLHGTTQAINFSGTDQDQTTGITMNSYGNIIGYPNATWWRIVSNSGSNIANFGIDKAGSNAVQFSRDLWVGNMGIGSAHQIRSKDGHGIYFTDNNSNRVDTYHNNIYYSGSVSKSLLSEKTNVKVADVNYWSNLAMSINLATYNYNTDDYTDPLRLSGIIDDVNTTKEWTLPEAFYARDEDGNIVGIDNGVLLNAVLALSQEQAKQIDKLNTNILAMEAKING